MSICVVPFVVCLVLRSLRFTACRVFSDCISLGVKQVAERLGITSGGLLNLKLPEPDAMIGRTRGWLPATIDGWNAKRPGRGVGGGRPPKKQVTGIRGWLRTNDLRFWRPIFYQLNYTPMQRTRPDGPCPKAPRTGLEPVTS